MHMRVVKIFLNREVCLRLVVALAPEQSEEWTLKRYPTMDNLKATENPYLQFRDVDHEDSFG